MSTTLPTFESYGNYTNENYGAHCLRFCIGSLSVWYSYKTPVAFYHPSTGKVVRENDWSTTTGKHLNAIDGGQKKSRISGEVFERKFEALLQDLKV